MSGVGVTEEDGIVVVVVGEGEMVGGVGDTVDCGSMDLDEVVEVEVATGGEVGKDLVVDLVRMDERRGVLIITGVEDRGGVLTIAGVEDRGGVLAVSEVEDRGGVLTIAGVEDRGGVLAV